MYDALHNFTINSFHVLLAALWGKNDPEQVTTESWDVQGKWYTAYIGNFGCRSSEGVTPHIPHELFPEIEHAIKGESLTQDTHWFRFFFCNVAGTYTHEALRDNEDWEAGFRCLESAAWLESKAYYSVRLFIVLRAG